MKKVLFLLALTMLFATLAVSAAEPGCVIAPFDDNPFVKESMGNCEAAYTATSALITTTDGVDAEHNGDPHINVDVDDFDSKYEWVKLRIKNLSDATQFEIHFISTATDGKLTGESCTHFPISTRDTEYKEYIYNVKEQNLASQSVNGLTLTESKWSGTISNVRLDCMWMAEPSGQMPKGSQMEIDYVAFFETEEDAKAYAGPKKISAAEMYKDYDWGKEDAPHFIFDNQESIDAWVTEGAGVELEMGNMKIMPSGADPIQSWTIPEEKRFDADTYHWLALRYKADTTVGAGGIFFTTSQVTVLSGANSYSSFPIKSNNEWNNIIVDMETYEHNNWKGIVNYVRLDAINGTDLNGVMYINRFGFFKSEEDAKAFLAQGGGEDFSDATFFNGNLSTAKIPGGILTSGYDKNQYLLQNTAEGIQNPVVSRTNADGSTEIIALSYTNGKNYTTYLANKPATYNVISNHKEYVDIAGHWGADYINFVSDRALFGGTSPTEFSPEDTMTRGMFITVLGRMHGLDTTKYDGNTGYTDVPATEYYAPYIQWAKEIGIMAGTSDTTFGPDQPILRETMALVIDKYIANSGYEFNIYSIEQTAFNDLGECDAATAEAIGKVQKAGIINGKGEGRFDPKGTSTRAEVATVMQRVIKSILGVGAPAGAKSHEYITRDRIRLGVWRFNAPQATEKGMKELADLGIDLIAHGGATGANPSRDVVLNYADLYGIEVFLNDYFTGNHVPSDSFADKFIASPESDPNNAIAEYYEHPSVSGHFINDEPGTDHYSALGKVAKRYYECAPEMTPFVNLLPLYANAAQLKMGAGASAIEYYDPDPDLYKKYCEAWFESYDYPYICTDIYPLLVQGGINTIYRDYVESINQIATVARNHDAEFWCCIQAHTWASSHRNPTEAEVRWQCYSMLSFGCTTILLWDYIGNANYPGIVNPTTGVPTNNYYACRPVMWEMRALSDAFVQYKNLGAFVNNPNNLDYVKMTGEYEGFETIKALESKEALLIGCFEKKEGAGSAFTVVNMEDPQKEANTATAKITLDPAAKVTVYTAGEGKEVALTDGVLELKLQAGEGVFVTVE